MMIRLIDSSRIIVQYDPRDDYYMISLADNSSLRVNPNNILDLSLILSVLKAHREEINIPS